MKTIILTKYRGNNRFKLLTSKKAAYDDYKTYCGICHVQPFSQYMFLKNMKARKEFLHNMPNFYCQVRLLIVGESYNF